MENATILLVEDNPEEEILTLRALKKNNIGNKILVARNGVEAMGFLFSRDTVDHASQNMPHLVLLDIKLPKVDGLEVLRRIRADQRTRLLPVVMLTSSNEEQDVVEAYRSGANSYMHKPVDYNQFSETMGQLGAYWLVLNQAPPC